MTTRGKSNMQNPTDLLSKVISGRRALAGWSQRDGDIKQWTAISYGTTDAEDKLEQAGYDVSASRRAGYPVRKEKGK
jgi:hypothetical protein